MQDTYNKVSPVVAAKMATRTANVTGEVVDLAGYDSVTFVVMSGTLTDGTYTTALKESDDGSTFTTVDSSQILGGNVSFAATDDDTVKKLGYVGGKRYVRLDITVSGATSGGVIGAIAVRANARHAPAS